jgi:oxygen-dependent protoporphyrinogen oxidase
MTPVAIVGAGITGLTAAFYLQTAGIPVTVYEASARAGGVIQTERRDGFLVERGPNTILESAPEVSNLVRDLELTSRCLYPAPGMTARYVARDGRVLALPRSLLTALETPLLSMRAKLRVLGEPFVKRGDGDDEALARFVTRRLGGELLDYMIDPFVGGVYAGDPERLSVAYAFPKLHALEQKWGSLITGTILGARGRKKRGGASKMSARMLTFDGGLSVLVDALQARLNGALQLGSAVTGVKCEGRGWTVETSSGERTKHAAVMLCAPGHGIARMAIDGVERESLSALGRIEYPPIARVALGFRRQQIAHALDGFGALIPKKEKLSTLGILFSSSMFPNRAPEGYTMLTSYLGGARWGGVVDTNDCGLVELALRDIRKLLGAEGAPVFSDVARIPMSIPQYNLGYGAVKAAIERIETRAPGVFLASSYSHGISVADCIVGGKASADRVMGHVRGD